MVAIRCLTIGVKDVRQPSPFDGFDGFDQKSRRIPRGWRRLRSLVVSCEVIIGVKVDYGGYIPTGKPVLHPFPNYVWW